ncbi:2-octaprenyl-3-methyl-6-methoxy-1,4-benzoquinol hydroxylase [Methylovorus glucosotrophus]|uniref:FAD-dependent monooxygenase n=1 Tax=Methylovorus glucosotrophus TaxID=266009 RepID=UPI001331897F|nr:FAD-dependent monooxygenase [Methylovorus glucosotrophus]KAF0836441.1 2-octaprenyl-3-methyl-6-methoxy-1,4-benzoquinol hydroxylase [Methylovorus glucosotrophus]
MSTRAEMVVVGGGLVGLATALAATPQGMHAILLDRAARSSEELTHDWDSRIYAITPGNAEWLAALGVWSRIPAERICPIDRMMVWGDSAQDQLHFDAEDIGASQLGFIVENMALQQALLQALDEAGVDLRFGTACAGASFSDKAATLTLESGEKISADLLVAADGGASWVRQQAGISSDKHVYAQQGLVANFETALPHGNIARQWLNKDGILAWLPLPGNRISIVWSTEGAKELLAMDAAALEARVAEAGQHALGALRLITPAAAFPLVKQTSHVLVKPHLALVGDAAHQVHPLAGQGVNLGFRDVVSLMQSLTRRHALQSWGDIQLLRHYERSRKTDMVSLQGLTHGLQLLFASEHPVLRRLRNHGMRLVDASALKKPLIQHAII